MPSLISASERQVLTGIFDDIFDTFCRNVVIYKQQAQTEVLPVPTESLFGFGPDQQQPTFTYQDVTGIFPAVIRYGDQNADTNPEMDAAIYNGPVSIKVRKDARDFINNGPTKHILVDGRIFKLDADERRQAFLDSEYYVFKLKNTK